MEIYYPLLFFPKLHLFTKVINISYHSFLIAFVQCPHMNYTVKATESVEADLQKRYTAPKCQKDQITCSGFSQVLFQCCNLFTTLDGSRYLICIFK